jgi:hypothetical protein
MQCVTLTRCIRGKLLLVVLASPLFTVPAWASECPLAKLGALGETSSNASGINDNGQMVEAADTTGDSDSHVIPGKGLTRGNSGWALEQATDADDNRQMAEVGVDSDPIVGNDPMTTCPVTPTTVPLPAAGLLFASGIVGLIGMVRRKAPMATR